MPRMTHVNHQLLQPDGRTVNYISNFQSQTFINQTLIYISPSACNIQQKKRKMFWCKILKKLIIFFPYSFFIFKHMMPGFCSTFLLLLIVTSFSLAADYWQGGGIWSRTRDNLITLLLVCLRLQKYVSYFNKLIKGDFKAYSFCSI